MFTRSLQPPKSKSFFLFGPRGTGKSSWVRAQFPNSLYFDLLESSLFFELTGAPDRLELKIPEGFKDWVIIDEIQKVPALLDEVHRLIEKRRLKFIMTGSSARKLKARGVNLLAGRALSYAMHPLTTIELGTAFNLKQSLEFGNLPSVFSEENPKSYLESYVGTYLKEEVQQEGLTRNIGAFARFMEAASFSQGSVLNISNVARDCSIDRKVVENYFSILDDLLLSVRLPVFTKRAKRKLVSHPKFYFFDAGVFRALRPKGPLDSADALDGLALETLVFQELRAINSNFHLGYDLFFWRSIQGHEVDFVLYGERGLKAFEVKKSDRLRSDDFNGLLEFKADYPVADLKMLYGGRKRYFEGPVEVVPLEEFFREIPHLLGK
jgi:uncharacterized protein